MIGRQSSGSFPQQFLLQGDRPVEQALFEVDRGERMARRLGVGVIGTEPGFAEPQVAFMGRGRLRQALASAIRLGCLGPNQERDRVVPTQRLFRQCQGRLEKLGRLGGEPKRTKGSGQAGPSQERGGVRSAQAGFGVLKVAFVEEPRIVEASPVDFEGSQMVARGEGHLVVGPEVFFRKGERVLDEAERLGGPAGPLVGTRQRVGRGESGRLGWPQSRLTDVARVLGIDGSLVVQTQAVVGHGNRIEEADLERDVGLALVLE